MLLRAGEIDQLQTQRDVERFVRKIDEAYRKEDIFGNRMDSGALHDHFFKLDLDGNGVTDLVVNGVRLLVIMDRGGHYDVYNLGKIHGFLGVGRTLLGIDSSDKPIKLLVQRSKEVNARINTRRSYVDTLVVCPVGIVEYNPHPDANFTFEGLTVSTNQCYGTCPIFEMRIDTDRSVSYDAIQFNKQTGKFHGDLPPAMYMQLVELLRYLQPDRLDSNYMVDWTDDQTISMEIHYNGKVKRISDYGETGTFGLRRLYALLFAYRNSLKWQPGAPASSPH
jgi:hypothetical protein